SRKYEYVWELCRRREKEGAPSWRPFTDPVPCLMRRHSRIQVCDLQMKATQPETSSFLPPSIRASLDLYTLPSSGLRMVPPEYLPPPSAFIPRMISMPVIGLPLRSSLHLSQVGLGRLGLISSTIRPLKLPSAAWVIST